MDETTQSTEKTFTQDEVNQIVQERLFKERKKYGEVDIDALKADTESLKGQLTESATKLSQETERADKLQAELDEIKKANDIRAIREKVAKESNIPADLLHGEDEVLPIWRLSYARRGRGCDVQVEGYKKV